MNSKSVIGVDLGGTNVRAGLIINKELVKIKNCKISSKGSEDQVLEEVITTINEVFEDSVVGIGIGVPSVVNTEKGVVYDVQNIPSWQEVHLKQKLEAHFKVPIYINNDANCFAIGEKYFGHGKPFQHIVGLITGTGMAAGIIANNKLYDGHNCGAGEYGMLPYKDYNYEYYCSGQFFTNRYNISGDQLYALAHNRDRQALTIFESYGTHLGNAIAAILYTLDPEIIILGGAVSKAYPFYKDTLWQRLTTFAYSPVINRLKIEVSTIPNIAILGAAALYLDEASNKDIGNA